ncbi:MAG: nitroreductase family protein [Bacteroidota bacterium]
MNIKQAETVYAIHDLIKKRWSPRAFSEQTVAKGRVYQLLEAARWSSSSYNDQPWRFIVGIKGDGPTYDKIFETLVEFNQNWAKTAPVLMLACAKIKSDTIGEDNKYFAYDTGQAVATMIFQATELGLYAHQMGGFSPDKARALFNIPSEYEPLSAIALGYPGDPEVLSDDLKGSELEKRQRKPLQETCFKETWENGF